MKSPEARVAADKEWVKFKNLSDRRKKTAELFVLHPSWIFATCMRNLQSTNSTKKESCSGETTSKTTTEDKTVFTEQGASASQMVAAIYSYTISKLLGRRSQRRGTSTLASTYGHPVDRTQVLVKLKWDVPSWDSLYVQRNSQLFSSVHGDDIKMVAKKYNIRDLCGQFCEERSGGSTTAEVDHEAVQAISTNHHH